MRTIKFNVNNREIITHCGETITLLEYLREELHIMGTKEGCGSGECGACTVLINNIPIHSCMTLLSSVENKNILTIEGISETELGKNIQDSYLKCGAVQCGFCTPGFIISTYALLKKYPDPTNEQIKIGLSGNLCRCTGYEKIIEAVKNCAKGDK